MKFDNVYHLVDSSDVLGYLHKQDTKLKPFEGIRVSEIKTTRFFTEGILHNWAWLDGDNNPAGWETQPRPVSELMARFFSALGI